VNENVNSDLFWALRGVGPGYIGIVTSFKFKLFNATDVRITSLSFGYNLEDVGPAFLAYQEWLVWAEKEGLNTRTTLNIRGIQDQFNVRIQLLEEISNGPTNAELFLNKANEIFPRFEIQEKSLTFPLYSELGNDEDGNEFISINVNAARYVKKKSFFVNRTFSAEELEKVVPMYVRARNLHVLIYHYGFTGVFNKIPATDMSYMHRGHLYLVSHRVDAVAEISGEEAQLAHDWLNEYDMASKVIDSGESYQNYVDLELSDNFMERYYGNNSQRLMEIKWKWDPDNYFKGQQSIPIANMAAKSLIILPTSFLCLCLLNILKNY